MNAKTTWLWILVAASLFAFIFFHQRHGHRPLPGPAKILPNLRPAEVTSVQVRPTGTNQPEIRAERTNNLWQLTEPVVYPAQAANVQNLLAALAALTPAAFITPGEILARPKADEEYGFTAPQASIDVLQGGERLPQILIGARTAPGDQVFLKVVGVAGAYVVNAGLLKFIPQSANDWRDTTLINLDGLAFDRVAVTNNSKAFVLQRDTTNRLWRMVWPLIPGARADNARIEDSLQKLKNVRIEQFVPEKPKTDLETVGLAPPDFELAFGQGTSTVAVLQFGKSPTNDLTQVYARRQGQETIFTVATNLLAPWRGSPHEFRDSHLLALTEPVEAVEVRVQQEAFSLQRQTNSTWRILPENLPADADLVEELLSTLTNLQIIQFVKDVVNPPDLPEYGLAAPAREYVLKATRTNSSSLVTNVVIADLTFGFGTNQPDKVFARRADESPVYAIGTNDFARLPLVGWQLRDRRFLHFSENDVAGATIRQQGKDRRLFRKGPYAWSLAPGSQGSINDLAIEEAVRALVKVPVSAWVARGAQNRARYGFTDDSQRITLELTSGDKATVEFGNVSHQNYRYAAVTLEGQLWIFDFPDVATYLSLP